MQCIATPTNALQTPTPIPIEFAMNTGRYTRIRTRQHSDPLFLPHPSRNAFAIALAHTSIYTQQHSIHRFAESCHRSNLHSTPLHPTFNFIHGYYILYIHRRHSHSHFRSASLTSRFTATSLHPHRHLFISTTLQPFTFIHFSLLTTFWAWAGADNHRRIRAKPIGPTQCLDNSPLLLFFVPFHFYSHLVLDS